jgi:protein TonB
MRPPIPLKPTDPAAAPEGCKAPAYPRDAMRYEIQGTVTLAFLIGLDGVVRDSKILRSSGNASLDDTARVALAKCQFKPGMEQRGEAWVQVQYVWTLQ